MNAPDPILETVAQATAAATLTPAPTPGVAANRSKRDEKPCEHCGKRFQRSVSANGYVEALSRFQKRRFCGLSCHTTVKNNRRWAKVREQRA